MSPPAARRSVAAAALAWASLSAAGLAYGHGASKGLHLHVSPDPAERGSVVTVEIDAVEPFVEAKVAFTGQDPSKKKVDPPQSRFVVDIRVPETVHGETINGHAEVRTRSGGTLRASLVLRISDPRPREGDEP